MKTINIVIDGIPIEVTYKKMKHTYLKICPPDGAVKISTPFQTYDKELQTFVRTKIDWIKTQQKKIYERAPIPPKVCTNEGEIMLWGERYALTLVTHETTTAWVEFEGNKQLVLHVPKFAVKDQIESIANELVYRQALKEEIPPLVHKWCAAMGVTLKEWRIKNMKTRWGTCNPNAGRIWLNLQLAKKPKVCLEYVVVHELVHLLEGSHNNIFKGYMDKFLPNWRIIKKEMNS